MDISTYDKFKEHLHLISFAAASPVFILIATHIITCKFSFTMNSLSIVKLTWAFISFLGRENLGLQHTIKRLIISILLIGICVFEMTNRQYFLDNTYIIGIDFFFTFVSLMKYYFQWINYYLKVAGLLENAYLIQTTITAVAVWKTHDSTVQDHMMPFALAYAGSAIYYALLFIIQFYVIQKGQKLTPESETNEKVEDIEMKGKKTNLEENSRSTKDKSELQNKNNKIKSESKNTKTVESQNKDD